VMGGRLSSWPAPPLSWIGHTDSITCMRYSPNGRQIISGSFDKTIRIWDAETGAAVGKPLEGHTDSIRSIAYSPNGQHIISASADSTIRIWDAKTGSAVVNPLRAHTGTVTSIACSPGGRHIVSGSWDTTIHVWDLFSHSPIQLSSPCNPIYAGFCVQPDANGWVRDSNNGLLYWVPPDCCTGLNSPALLTIPPTSHTRSVSLDFEGFVFGTSWTQIFNSAIS
jgi:WD40 repeat protein